MVYRLIKKKKGFTFIELIVVIAILAVLVGIATPNYIKTVTRREKSSAEYDAQHIYRLAISAVTDLKWQRLSPTASTGMFDSAYAEAIVKKMYDSALIMDIGLKYYTGEGNNVKVPDGYTPDIRAKMINGGNVNPYVVIQVKNLDNNYTLIISYHNDANPFTFDETERYNVDFQNIYKTNKNKAIIYSYLIRF